MEEDAEAFIVLPGGIGTLEEFFETLTLKQLGLRGKLIALLNTLGYFDALRALLEQTAESGFMSRGCLGLCAFCGTPGEALDHVETAAPLTGGLRRLEDYTR